MTLKTILAALFGLGAVGTFSICDLCVPAAQGQRASTATGLPQQLESKMVRFHVKGMTCGGCVYGVRKVLTRLPGVLKADVSYERSSAVVTYDPAKVTVEKMAAAIATLGYTATVMSI